MSTSRSMIENKAKGVRGVDHVRVKERRQSEGQIGGG